MDDFGMEAKKPRKRLLNARLKGCTRLNVRSASSSDSSVTGVLTDKDRIKVDAGTKDRDWVAVYEPIYGYAKKEFLEVT